MHSRSQFHGQRLSFPTHAIVIIAILCSAAVAQYTLSTVAGVSNSAGNVDGYVPNSRLYLPVEMKGWGHPTGNMFISDRTNGAVRVLNPSNNYLSTFATGLGSICGISNVDPSGNIYTGDQNTYRIWKITSSGSASILGTFSWRTYGIWYSYKDGFLYSTAIDYCTVHRVNPNNGADSVYAGTSCGINSNSGVYRTSTQYYYVLSAGGTSNGDFYFTQYTAYVINRIDYASGNSYLIAGAVNIPGYVDGAATSARFSNVYGVDATEDGYVYIADTGSQRVRMLHNGIVTTVAGTGAGAQTDGPALSNAIGFPWGLSAHISGKLYVVAYSYSVIRLISGLPHQESSYCCNEVIDECSTIHGECNAISGQQGTMAAACSADASVCSIYTAGQTLLTICTTMASNCDALISHC